MRLAKSSVVGLSGLRFSSLLLGRIVLKQFIDEIDVGHQHTTATVTRAAKLGHRVAIAFAFFEESEVSFIKISNDLQRISGHRDEEATWHTLPQEKQRMGMIIVTASADDKSGLISRGGYRSRRNL